MTCLECGQEKPYYIKRLCKMCYIYHWQRENPKRVAAINHRYYEKNRKQQAASMRQSYEKNREKRLAYQHCWKQDNPDKVAANKTRRRGCKLAVANTLTVEQLEFERRIGEATYPGEKLHIHHLVPLSKGGGNTWGNILIIPARIHRNIGTRLPEEIYQQLPLF